MRIMTVGHACIDIVHWIPRGLSVNNKSDSIDSRLQIGGSAANVGGALRRLGADAILCAVLGSTRDPLTTMLLASLANMGVETDCIHVELPCPNSIVAVSANGDNSLSSYQPLQIINAIHVPSSLEGISMIMGDIYRLPMVERVFAMARAAGIPTMLDVDKALPSYEHLPPADFVWFSQEAWRAIDEPMRSLSMASNHFGGSVGTTDGSNPVTWIDANGTVAQHRPPKVLARSTLGAGDVFRAALAIGICQGYDLFTAVAAACASAGQHVAGESLASMYPEQ